MAKRLSGNQSSVICYSMAVMKDGRLYLGQSQMFETAAGHAERQCVRKLCADLGIDFRDGAPGQMKADLDDRAIHFDYLYVDFEPCKHCEPWLESLVGSNVPVYYLEDFPYQDFKQVEFRKTYQNFQKKYFGDSFYREEAKQKAAELAKQLTLTWERALGKALDFLLDLVKKDLLHIAQQVKDVEQPLSNLVGRGAAVADALRRLIPVLGFNPQRYLGSVTIGYDDDRVRVESTWLTVAVLRILLAEQGALKHRAGQFDLPEPD